MEKTGEKLQGLLKERLKEKGLKVTQQRMIVVEAFAEHKDKHLSAEDVYEIVRADHPEIGLATVYRTVQLLSEIQLLDRIILDDGCVRYEIRYMPNGDMQDLRKGAFFPERFVGYAGEADRRRHRVSGAGSRTEILRSV